jgi:8-oxo-dGTP pyrophosphatase MutT (NUDIX family)
MKEEFKNEILLPEGDAERREKLRITAGGIVINENGDVLLVQQESGNWVFPKGGVETKEMDDLLSAAKREIEEETGLKDGELKLLGEFESYERPAIDEENEWQRIHMFHFKTDKMLVGPSKGFEDEIKNVRWVRKEEVLDLLVAPKDKEFFLREIISL